MKETPGILLEPSVAISNLKGLRMLLIVLKPVIGYKLIKWAADKSVLLSKYLNLPYLLNISLYYNRSVGSTLPLDSSFHEKCTQFARSLILPTSSESTCSSLPRVSRYLGTDLKRYLAALSLRSDIY